MIESFAQLFEESLKTIETRPGSIVRGVVVSIDKDIVLVDAGLKSESAIPAEQFKNAQGELEIQVGDEVDVALDAVEDGFGETLLSREKAKRHEAWLMLEKSLRRSCNRYWCDQRQSEGRLYSRTERYPCVPAWFTG